MSNHIRSKLIPVRSTDAINSVCFVNLFTRSGDGWGDGEPMVLFTRTAIEFFWKKLSEKSQNWWNRDSVNGVSIKESYWLFKYYTLDKLALKDSSQTVHVTKKTKMIKIRIVVWDVWTDSHYTQQKTWVKWGWNGRPAKGSARSLPWSICTHWSNYL